MTWLKRTMLPFTRASPSASSAANESTTTTSAVMPFFAVPGERPSAVPLSFCGVGATISRENSPRSQ
jgi:hypothetical protein